MPARGRKHALGESLALYCHALSSIKMLHDCRGDIMPAHASLITLCKIEVNMHDCLSHHFMLLGLLIMSSCMEFPFASCFDDHVFLIGLRCFPMGLSSLRQHDTSELLEQAAETTGNEHQRFIMQASNGQ